jgi:ParB family chromosome partitioning protein
MSSPAVEKSTGLQTIPLSAVFRNVNNPRKHFDPASLKELAKSIESHGILQPLVVRPDPMGGKKYELVAGERRWRAAKIAGKADVPVIVSTLSDREALEIMVIENLQREDVQPLEEARGYQSLMNCDKDVTVESIAAKVGMSVGYVYARLKLIALIPAAAEALERNFITPGHAVLMARLQPGDQVQALYACFSVAFDKKTSFEPQGGKFADIIRDDDGRESPLYLSEKGLREWIQDNVNLKLKGVPWDLDDVNLVPQAGSCVACPKRSGSNPALFAELTVKGEDTCFDPVCFKEKREAFVQLEIKKDKEAAKSENRKRFIESVGPHDKSGQYEEADVLRQLSEQTAYSEAKPDQKVLKAGQWLPAKAGSCSSVEKGMIVRGDNAGERKLVCCNAACKVHRHKLSASSTGSRSAPVDYDLQRYQEHKKRIRGKKKAAARAQLARQIVAKTGTAVPADLLRQAVVSIAERRDGADLLWLLGMDPKAAHAADFGKVLGKAKGVQLNQLLVAALMMGFLNEYSDDNKDRAALAELAKALNLKNPQGLLSSQDERINKLRTCRGCGCTEEAACEYYDQKKGKHVSCHWVEDDLCSFEDCAKYAPKKPEPAKTQTPAKAKKGKSAK